jgi:hypothetical protein
MPFRLLMVLSARILTVEMDEHLPDEGGLVLRNPSVREKFGKTFLEVGLPDMRQSHRPDRCEQRRVVLG